MRMTSAKAPKTEAAKAPKATPQKSDDRQSGNASSRVKQIAAVCPKCAGPISAEDSADNRWCDKCRDTDGTVYQWWVDEQSREKYGKQSERDSLDSDAWASMRLRAAEVIELSKAFAAGEFQAKPVRTLVAWLQGRTRSDKNTVLRMKWPAVDDMLSGKEAQPQDPPGRNPSPPTLDGTNDWDVVTVTDAVASLSKKQDKLIRYLWGSNRSVPFHELWEHSGAWDAAKLRSDIAIEKMIKRTRERLSVAGIYSLTLEISELTVRLHQPQRDSTGQTSGQFCPANRPPL